MEFGERQSVTIKDYQSETNGIESFKFDDGDKSLADVQRAIASNSSSFDNEEPASIFTQAVGDTSEVMTLASADTSSAQKSQSDYIKEDEEDNLVYYNAPGDNSRG
jgi:multidrug efflux pump subunit AcrB